MIVAVVEKHEQLWRRHVGAIIVGGFALLLVVIVAGRLFEKGHVADWLADAPEQRAYVLCGVFAWFDAVIAIFPGETTLSAASTLAARGDLNLQLVMVAGALGAILGDSSVLDRSQERRQDANPGASRRPYRRITSRFRLGRSPAHVPKSAACR
jgi:hypothetical protein